MELQEAEGQGPKHAAMKVLPLFLGSENSTTRKQSSPEGSRLNARFMLKYMPMKLAIAFRRVMIILALYSIALLEAHFLPRFGYSLEWLLGALALTAFVGGCWIRTHWG